VDLRIVMGPFEQDNLWPAIQTEWQKRPAETAIDVEPAFSCTLQPFDATIASRWKPKRRHPGKAPLPSVTMSAKDEIHVMVLFQLFKDVGRMG